MILDIKFYLNFIFVIYYQNNSAEKRSEFLTLCRCHQEPV